MIIPALKFIHRSTLIFIEIAVAFFFVFLGLTGLLFWKLSHGPVDVTFAADAIKRTLVSEDHTTDLQFDKIVAEWPEYSGPISIGLSGLKLLENDKPILNIPQLGIRIAKTPLLIGMVRPEAIIAKNATIKLYRAKNGGVHLLLNDVPPSSEPSSVPPSPVATEEESSAGFKELGEALFKGGNLPDYHEIQPLSDLERFSVDKAHIVIVDEETGKGWDLPQLDFDLLRAREKFTVTARYQEGKESVSNFSFLLEKNRKDNLIHFSSNIDRINASVLGQVFLPVQLSRGPQFLVKGKVEGVLNEKDWGIEKLDSDVISEQGTLALDGIYETPLKFANLAAHISYDRTSNKIALHDTRVDINNRTLQLSGEKLAGEDSSPVFGLRIQIPQISFDDIHALWPESQKDTLAADWLTKRLSKATIHNMDMMIPINIKDPAAIDPTQLEMAFDFENLTADYQVPLIPATEANGKATFKGDTLAIDVASGKLGDMTVKKGRVEITHLTHPTLIGDVTIDADATGPVAGALKYIARDPIGLDDEIGLKPETVKGQADLNVHVVFPALRDVLAKDVKVTVGAKMDNVLLPSIVRGMDLTGGPYSVVVKDGGVMIAGKGALGGQNIDLTYSEYLDHASAPYISNIKADIITDKTLREKFGVHLDQFVTGNVPTQIAYQQNKDNSETVDIVADVTPAIVAFSPFEYKKPVGKSGKATCHVDIRNGEVKKISDLTIAIDKEGEAKGNIDFGQVGGVNDVKSGKFSSFTLAGENDFALDFTQTAPDIFDVVIKGKQLDGRPFIGGGNGTASGDSASASSPKGGSAVTAKVDVARIKTGDKPEQGLQTPTLSLKTNRDGDVTFLDLKGSFKGGNITVSLKPDAKGKTQMAILSNNAGAALHTLDIYNQMVGGTLEIRGSQIADGGVNDIAGRGQISNFTVVKAPILAKLINLFSLSGLQELLENKGIGFEKLKTDFEWKDTKSGRVIALRNGRTSGASIGLTFGGNVYQDKGTMDISGTFVPMSEINSIVNKIPVIGDLLTGGKNGGVIAATYAMTGNSDDPQVTVNPLSVLTPGFLRSILFENNTTIFEDKGKGKAPRPKSGVNQ